MSVGGARASFQLDLDIVAGIQAGRIYYDGSNVKKCFDSIAQATCDKTDQDSRGIPAACTQFTHGLGMSGDQCFVDAECASGFCSASAGSPTCQIGQCVGDTAPSVEPAALGEPCNFNTTCVAGAYCDQELTSTCVPLKMQGATCQVPGECAYGLGCVTDTTGTRTCGPLPGPNQPCTSNVGCRDEGYYCDELTSAMPTCKPLGLAGAMCMYSEQCSTYYPCDGTGHCTKAPSVGQSCSTTYKCFDAGTYCDTTTYLCTARRGDGAMCTADTDCNSNNCDLDLAVPICTTPTACM